MKIAHRAILCLILSIFVCITYQVNVKSITESENISYYGFIIPVYSNQSYQQQCEIVKCINNCFKNSIDVWWLTEDMPCKISPLDTTTAHTTRSIPRGSYIINNQENAVVVNLVLTNLVSLFIFEDVPIFFLMEPLHDIQCFRLRRPRIAVHGGDNVCYWSYEHLIKEAGFQTATRLGWKEIPQNLNHQDYDVFMWGGLSGDTSDVLLSQINITNIKTFNTIRSFINEGGGYIGSCYGAYQIPTLIPFPFHQLLIKYPSLPSLFFLSVSTRIPIQALPGVGPINISIIDQNSPLSYGLPQIIPECYYAKGPMFLGRPGNTDTIAILKDINMNWFWFDEHLADHPLINSLRDTWMTFSVNKPIWVTVEFGDGIVIAFGDHPEFSDDFPRIIYNALYLATAKNKETVSITEKKSIFHMNILGEKGFRGYQQTPIIFQLHVSQEENLYNVTWIFDQNHVNRSKTCRNSYPSCGNYNVVVTAINSKGHLNVTTLPIVIAENINGRILHHPINPAIHQEIQFTSNITGGFPPYTYKWTIQNSTISTNDTLNYTCTQSGTYTMSLSVTDTNGGQIKKNTSFDVSDSHHPIDNNKIDDKNGFPYFFIVIFGIITSVFFLFLFIRYRRK